MSLLGRSSIAGASVDGNIETSLFGHSSQCGSSLGNTITIYRRGQPPRTFYGEEDYHRFQVQEAEELWNNWSSTQRFSWWLFALCCGSRQPRYGIYPSLIGKPGLVPGTRIPFEHHFRID